MGAAISNGRVSSTNRASVGRKTECFTKYHSLHQWEGVVGNAIVDNGGSSDLRDRRLAASCETGGWVGHDEWYGYGSRRTVRPPPLPTKSIWGGFPTCVYLHEGAGVDKGDG